MVEGIDTSVYTGPLHHVGIVVRDIEAAMAHFEALGFGPFKFNDEMRTFTIDFAGELHGEPEEWSVKVSNGMMGDVEFELLEPCGGKSALQESLDASGEGLHHVGFLTDDIRRDIAQQTARGAKIWTMSLRTDAPSFVYFEPSSVGNVAIELRTAGVD
jgi:catechol 2,3-dioxygenase-like lactoylglutathione lyase family enzyme